MLSKLQYYLKSSNFNNVVEMNFTRSEITISDLVKYYLENGNQNLSIDETSGGTLGVCYKAEINNKAFFIKTHQNDSVCRNNFLKEVKIFSFLYGESISIQQIDLNKDSSEQSFLVMEQLLYPCMDLAIPDVIDLICSYQNKLTNNETTQGLSEDYSFNSLIVEAKQALKNLSDNKFISTPIANQAYTHIDYLIKNQHKLKPCICHGDLGPKNIMTNGNINIAIDWEDAFMGVEGYDYLYWLTFFKNRRFWSQEIFGKTPSGKKIEIGIMIIIVILKCELSVRSKSYHTNSMTFDQRILEILSIE